MDRLFRWKSHKVHDEVSMQEARTQCSYVFYRGNSNLHAIMQNEFWPYVAERSALPREF